MIHYIVTAAIIINENQVLCMQRGKSKYDYVSYKFEFPGGKVEDGESHEEALSRELKEEMDIDVQIKSDDFYMMVNHVYEDFEITMHCYTCHVDCRDFSLKEHVSYEWMDVSELGSLDWAGADLPVVERLRAAL